MENARFLVDVTVDEVSLHEVFLPHFRRIVDEGVAVGHERLQLGERALVRRERRAVDRGAARRVGIRRVRDQRLDLRAAPRAGVGAGRPRRRDALPDAARPGPARCPRASRDLLGRRRPRRDPAASPPCCASTTCSGTPPPGIDVLACAEHRALAREAAAKSAVVLRNEPVAGTPLLPLDPAALRRVAVVGRLGAVRNLGDGGSSDVWAPAAVTVVDGLRRVAGWRRGRRPRRGGRRGRRARGGVVRRGRGGGRLHPPGRGRVHRRRRDRPSGRAVPGPRRPRPGAALHGLRRGGPGPRACRGRSPVAEPMGFAPGGDRLSLRLHAEDEALIAAVAAANAAYRRGHRGGQRRGRLGLGPARAGRRAVLVRGDGGWPRPGRRAAGHGRRRGPPPLHGAQRRGAPTAFRRATPMR